MQSIDDFRDARDVLNNVLLRTNLIYSRYFSGATGNKVYLKPENMQITGSFKVRGAFYKVSTLSKEQRDMGLVTSSAGNHAQGVAYAASQRGVSATIVMPTATPLVKVNNTKSHGAEVVLKGELYDEAYNEALRISEETGAVFVHPFNDEEVATGQGTIAYEILKDLPDVDVILVPIGGGGLAAGVATLVKLLNPGVKVYGVEPKGAAGMALSVKNGRVTPLDKVETIADGVAVKTIGDFTLPYIMKNVDDIILVDDKELTDVFLDLTESHKMIVENAGLLAVAALYHLNEKGRNVVPILSGGNMDVITMSTLVQHGLINRGRIFTFSVLLPDRPGELVKISSIIAECKGNIIKLDHNQFVHINRNSAVGLTVTLEAFGNEHKDEIVTALRGAGYEPVLGHPHSIY
jgi:threonine dehydratase